MKVSDKDKAFAKTLKKIVDDAKFESKGEAVATVAACLSWLAQLESRIEESLASNKLSEAKEVEGPINEL